jgi:flagellar motor protein MotB
VALYLAKNPSLQIGLDGSMNPSNPTLSGERVVSVRTALEQAGVPDQQIQVGELTDPQSTHDGRLEVLVSTR